MTPASSTLGPVVCVPARDEAERLPYLLRSLSAQDGFSHAAPLAVVVLANNCVDGTGDAVRTLVNSGEMGRLDLHLIEVTLRAPEAHVGTARRMALDAGAELLEAGGPDGVLLTTDADAWLPPHWIAGNLRALHDADIVGGRLVIETGGPVDPVLADLHERIERYWSAVRALEDRLDPPPHDPAPRHGDHTGASLAFRIGLYRAVGGLPSLSRGEDNAFVARVVEQGGRLRHCPHVHVHVSDRTAGRAEGGMASEMIRRTAVLGGSEQYVLPEPEHWHEMITRRATLRRIWSEVSDAWTCDQALLGLGLTHDDFEAIAPETCRNDIAFVERAARRLERTPAKPPLVGIDEALASFSALLQQLDDRTALRGEG